MYTVESVQQKFSYLTLAMALAGDPPKQRRGPCARTGAPRSDSPFLTLGPTSPHFSELFNDAAVPLHFSPRGLWRNIRHRARRVSSPPDRWLPIGAVASNPPACLPA